MLKLASSAWLASIGLIASTWHLADTQPANADPNETFGFFSPEANGGSMLELVPGADPPGSGEPLNVIISGHSDPRVLLPSHDNGGLFNYFESLDFSESCGGLNLGAVESANLGDGQGVVGSPDVMRFNFGDPVFGTCRETEEGGNHFRWFLQNGTQAQSHAVFLATSFEFPASQSHLIVPDGYNLGRDLLVGNATQTTIASPNPLSTITPTANGIVQVPNVQFIGKTSANGFTYQTTATYLWGLLGNTSVGVNHNSSVPLDGRPALDGLVALLVVNITATNAAAVATVPNPALMIAVTLCVALTAPWTAIL